MESLSDSLPVTTRNLAIADRSAAHTIRRGHL